MDNESIVICRELRDDVERRISRVTEERGRNQSEDKRWEIGQAEKEEATHFQSLCKTF